MNTSRYLVEYPRSFVLGGKKIFRSGDKGGGGGKLGNRREKKEEEMESKKKKELPPRIDLEPFAQESNTLPVAYCDSTFSVNSFRLLLWKWPLTLCVRTDKQGQLYIDGQVITCFWYPNCTKKYVLPIDHMTLKNSGQEVSLVRGHGFSRLFLHVNKDLCVTNLPQWENTGILAEQDSSWNLLPWLLGILSE